MNLIRCNMLILLMATLTGSRGMSQVSEEPTSLSPLEEAGSNIQRDGNLAEWNIERLPLSAGSRAATHHFLEEGQFYWGGELIVFDAPWGPGKEDDTIAATRLRLGWEHESGLGIRARYLMLDRDWNVENSPFSTQIVDAEPGDVYQYAPHYRGSVLLAREIDNLNLDFYKRFTMGESEVLFGSGLTTVRDIVRLQNVFDEAPPADDYSYEYADESLKGLGIGLFGELRRPVYVRDTTEVAFLLNGRTSFVPVEAESQSELVSLSLDDDLWIHEAQIGVELRKRLQSFTFVLRGQYEVQKWDAGLVGNPGFDGVSFSVGLGW